MELTNIQFLKMMDKLCHVIPYCNECPIMKLGEEKKRTFLYYTTSYVSRRGNRYCQ